MAVDRFDAARDTPRGGEGLTARGCALLCLPNPRAELATMLILQELGLTVDLAADAESAIRWVQRARYELIVVGGGGTLSPLATTALRLRHAAPEARIVVLADEWDPPDGLDPLGVQVLRPPMDVNALMRWLWPSP